VELTDSQVAVMESQPFLCMQYARRIAKEWLEEYHRRPSVYFTDLVALAPYRVQLLVDPRADLATVQYHLFGHNDWISDLQRIPANSPFGL
jgi:hypothetical protein